MHHELSQLAKVHVGVRSGVPRVRERQLLDRHSFQTLGGVIWASIVPGGQAAACICSEAESHDGYTDSSVHFARQMPGSGTWLTPVTHEGRPRTREYFCSQQGWGQRFFAILHHIPAQPGLYVQVYDCHTDRWLPQVLVPESRGRSRAELGACLPVTFCDSEELGAVGAGHLYSSQGPSAALIIFSTVNPFAAVSYCRDVYEYRWLPDSTSLLVLGEGSMARLDLDTVALPASGLLELRWIDLPAVDGSLPTEYCEVPPSMDLIPGTPSAVLLFCWATWNEDTDEGAVVCLTLYDAAGITAGRSRHKAVPANHDLEVSEYSDYLCGERCTHHTVHCSRTRVAVCLKSAMVYLFELERDRVGKEIAEVEYLESVSFSACSFFLAGCTLGHAIAVLDAQHGKRLVLIPSEQVSAGLPCHSGHAYLCVVAWTAAGQLQIVASVQNIEYVTASALLSVCCFV